MNVLLIASQIIMWILLLTQSTLAAGKLNKYCTTLYGENSFVSFEPIESNRVVKVSHSMFSKSDPKIERSKDTPLPTGFYCLKNSVDLKCAKGLKLDTKRGEFPMCVSDLKDLRELCPNGFDSFWPELTKKICAVPEKMKEQK
jgi:hypothetical protein